MSQRIPTFQLAEITGVGAVLSIGAARLGYEQFYWALGTSVDEIGLSSWQMVTASVAGMLALAPSAWVAVFAGVAVGRRSVFGPGAVWKGALVAVAVLAVAVVPQGGVAHTVWLPLNVALGAGLVTIWLVRPDWVARREQFRLTFQWFALVAVTITLLWWASHGLRRRSRRSPSVRTARAKSGLPSFSI